MEIAKERIQMNKNEYQNHHLHKKLVSEIGERVSGREAKRVESRINRRSEPRSTPTIITNLRNQTFAVFQHATVIHLRNN